jgi:hypothetical protein
VLRILQDRLRRGAGLLLRWRTASLQSN